MQSASLVAALARKLSKSSSDAAVTLLRSIREQHGLAEVSAEAAELASRRSLPLVKLPAVLETEVDALLAEQGITTREAGRLAEDIRDRLKKLSHSPHRGGLTPARSKPPSTDPSNQLFPHALRAHTPGRQPRLRGAELSAAREALEVGDVTGMSGVELNAALGLPPPLEEDERLAEVLRKVVPSYRSMDQALGYLVARFTPEYAACRRVLQEAAGLLASRSAAPGPAAAGGGTWPPREVLVHGAGCGAAVVALLEALPLGSLGSVVAVEDSIMRQTLGARLERRYRAAASGSGGTDSGGAGSAAAGPADPSAGAWNKRPKGASGAAADSGEDGGGARPGAAAAGGGWPRVSWVRSLAPVHRSPGAQRKRYDLVLAPYQLTLLPTREAKMALVRQLWERCGGALALVEPGTPAGFGDLAEARQLLLALEARRGQQLQAALERGDARAAAKLAGSGAHVVAPCPHDGACPLWKPGRRAWCHFEQPLLRPNFMRDTADRRPPGAPPPRRVGARDKQDERFSYLVIRRGPRPQQRVAVAREYAPPPAPSGGGGKLETAAAAAAAGLRLPQRAVLMQVLINRQEAAGAEASATGAGAALAAGTGSNSNGVVGAGGQARTPLFGRSAGAGADAAAGPAAAATEAALAAPGVLPAEGGSRSSSSPAIAAFARKHPAYGPGLVGRLLALQEAGVDWAAASAEASAPEEDAEEDQMDGAVGVAPGDSDSNSSGNKPVASGAQRRPGLDAALAQMAMAVAVAPPGSVAPSPPDAEALRAALLQAGRQGAGGAHAEEMEAEHSSGGSSSSSGHVARLSRKDVSDAEYMAAEAELLQRVHYIGAAGNSTDGAAAAGDDSDSDSDSDSDGEERGLGRAAAVAAPPADVALALASSYGWGRLLRPPRRRGGHVLLDVCMGPQQQYLFVDQPVDNTAAAAAAAAATAAAAAAAERAGEGAQGAGGVGGGQRADGGSGGAERSRERAEQEQESTAGRTVQQIVARSARKSWMGAPAYRMARQLGWGDVWPDWFARSHTAREVGPTGGRQEQRRRSGERGTGRGDDAKDGERERAAQPDVRAVGPRQ
ncbi:hypothetical protein HXX76_014635 [Chlamydomonas incerta]|uniref:Uncharacterized protein n=1 Tax=Chlamydomonas incerta TaxID=51695 RepID=A0A835SBI4_CHLIN|nr:hypothetical protein HXX76_014635 [Chlamydomonas incerta]|eukprot:KAG2424252.1 hypothetical protein HXX76_014635 [Chlamydomonas incerta]